MSVEITLPSRLRERYGRHRDREHRRGRHGTARSGRRRTFRLVFWMVRWMVPRPVRRGIRRWARRLVVVSAAGLVGSAALGALGAGAAAIVGVRFATRRVVVEGRSMVPTFEPGDRLLVVRLARRWPVRPGDVVAFGDPREPDRLLVKRVSTVGDGWVTVAGDNVTESTDSRSFGAVERGEVWGRVWYRYAPRDRAGRVGRRAP